MENMNKTVRFVLDIICVMTVTVTSFFIYSTVSQALDAWLQSYNITNPWLKLAIIFGAALAILLVFGRQRLGKAIQRLFGKW